MTTDEEHNEAMKRSKEALLKLLVEDPNARIMPMDIGDLVFKMSNSAFNIIMWWQHKDLLDLAKNPELAMQIGIGMSLDKPTILLVKRGETAPRGLVRAADAVIDDIDYTDINSWQPKMQTVIEKMAENLGIPRRTDPGTAGEVRPTDNADDSEPR